MSFFFAAQPLVADPPPYRPNPVLRGPRHLQVTYDAVAPAAEQARAGARSQR